MQRSRKNTIDSNFIDASIELCSAIRRYKDQMDKVVEAVGMIVCYSSDLELLKLDRHAAAKARQCDLIVTAMEAKVEQHPANLFDLFQKPKPGEKRWDEDANIENLIARSFNLKDPKSAKRMISLAKRYDRARVQQVSSLRLKTDILFQLSDQLPVTLRDYLTKGPVWAAEAAPDDGKSRMRREVLAREFPKLRPHIV